MKPKTLSASAIEQYETCSASFKASYIDRVPNLSGDAASLGTVVHETLQEWVESGAYKTEDLKDLLKMYEVHYASYFTDGRSHADGISMLKNWFNRQDWDGVKVLSTELKETFDLKVPGYGVIPFTYIWDRCDELAGDVIEVIDYKSYRMALQPDDLKSLIQVRAYALAAKLKYPHAKRIWVTYDLLRYDKVGVSFTDEDCRDTYRYLVGLAKRILADPGTSETLNPKCRWCVRKATCSTLEEHVVAGGELAVQDVDEAIDRRAELDYAIKALQTQVESLDEFILKEARDEESGFTERKTEKTSFKLGGRRTRTVDSRITQIIPHETYVKFATMGAGQFDKMISSGLLTEEEEKAAQKLVIQKMGRMTIKTKPLHEFDEK